VILTLYLVPPFLLAAVNGLDFMLCAHRTWALNLTLHFMCALVVTVAYRLSPFHPLYDIPGPLMAKVSGLWRAYVNLTGKQYNYFGELHEQYGVFVRVGEFNFVLRI
jgi:hypothetical protein